MCTSASIRASICGKTVAKLDSKGEPGNKIYVSHRSCDASRRFEVPISHIVALVGDPTYLPCDISTTHEGDSVHLVLWYREDHGTSIYSALPQLGSLQD
ncbi:hypothetical protein KM043_010258 [Ampulex compressa]|nr:hypothetical protein KM043_010258 [Ampulex compressa]